MERTRKTWGERWLLFKNDLCEISYLELEPNRRCSWHYHKTKFNLFFVTEGELYIKLEDGIAKIEQFQIFTTKPDEMHEFQTHDKPAKILEIMYVQYEAADIMRDPTQLGGKLNE